MIINAGNFVLSPQSTGISLWLESYTFEGIKIFVEIFSIGIRISMRKTFKSKTKEVYEIATLTLFARNDKKKVITRKSLRD